MVEQAEAGSASSSHWELVRLVGMRDPRMHRCVARTSAMLILGIDASPNDNTNDPPTACTHRLKRTRTTNASKTYSVGTVVNNYQFLWSGCNRLQLALVNAITTCSFSPLP